MQTSGPEGLLLAPAYDIDFAPFEKSSLLLKRSKDLGGFSYSPVHYSGEILVEMVSSLEVYAIPSRASGFVPPVCGFRSGPG